MSCTLTTLSIRKIQNPGNLKGDTFYLILIWFIKDGKIYILQGQKGGSSGCGEQPELRVTGRNAGGFLGSS